MNKESLSIPEDYVEFDVEKEEWGALKLKDGAIIKVKFVLISLRKASKEGYDANAQTLIGALVPKPLRGSPSARKYSEEELRKSIIDYDVGFEVIKEPRSIYKLSDGNRLIVRVIVSQVMKTDKFNPRGEPIYIVQWTTAVKILPIEHKLSKSNQTP